MTWLIASLAVLAGLFYGMWQRSRAKRYQREAVLSNDRAVSAEVTLRDHRARAEALIASLKTEITRLEAAALANATPDELRARLAALLRSSPKD